MERMYFFDSTQDDQRIYQAADFARFHAQIIGNGVSNTPSLPDLEVTAKTNMDVALGAGYMFANGYMYENVSTMTLKHAIADPTNDRIDRIVIAFDNNPAERRIYPYIKKGVPGASPTPPNLQRDSYVFEMSVAQVRIIAGKSFVEQSEIDDERTDDDVCGYIPLHNIYRGLRINENGAVTMPYQSFIKTESFQSVPIEIEQDMTIPLYGILLDKQGEISGNTFIPKNDGIYNLWAEIGFEDGIIPAGATVEVYIFVNGIASFPITARVSVDSSDNYFIGSGFDQLQSGDEVKFVLRARNLGEGYSTRLIRVRITKVA